MKKILIIFWVFFLAAARISWSQIPNRPAVQSNPPQQSVYLELGGNGLIYSLNYDLLFESNWGFRIGGAFFPFDITDKGINDGLDNNSHAFIGVIMGHHTIGKTNHKLEIGGGLLYGKIYDRNKWDYIEPPGLTASLGYRYLPRKPKYVTFKAAFTPLINRSGFHPRVGFGIGIMLYTDDTSKLQKR